MAKLPPSMIFFLFFIPVLGIVSALLAYRHVGKRDFLRFDMVQLVYAFLMAPLFFVWIKSFFFFLLRQQLQISLSLNELFLIDTLVSVLMLFVYAFIVIHSLTKTFELKREKDPLYDLFEHSEFFHLDFSHLVVYAGAIGIFTVLSVTNAFVPLAIEISQTYFYLILAVAFFAGLAGFIGVWTYEPQSNFMRLMKLLFAVAFLIHMIIYLSFDPNFTAAYVLYWFIFIMSAVTVALSFFAEKPEAKGGFLQRLPFQLNPKKPRYYWRYLRLKLVAFVRKQI